MVLIGQVSLQDKQPIIRNKHRAGYITLERGKFFLSYREFSISQQRYGLINESENNLLNGLSYPSISLPVAHTDPFVNG